MDKVPRHFQPVFLNRIATNPLLHCHRLLCCDVTTNRINEAIQ
jgi:hypothetical protein